MCYDTRVVHTVVHTSLLLVLVQLRSENRDLRLKGGGALTKDDDELILEEFLSRMSAVLAMRHAGEYKARGAAWNPRLACCSLACFDVLLTLAPLAWPPHMPVRCAGRAVRVVP